MNPSSSSINPKDKKPNSSIEVPISLPLDRPANYSVSVNGKLLSESTLLQKLEKSWNSDCNSSHHLYRMGRSFYTNGNLGIQPKISHRHLHRVAANRGDSFFYQHSLCVCLHVLHIELFSENRLYISSS